MSYSDHEHNPVPLENLGRLSERLENASPHEIIVWAVETYGPDIAMSCSFQMQSLPLLHIISQVAPHLSIIFLDTGYHFGETLGFRDRLVQAWGLDLRVLRAAMPQEEFADQQGDELYRRDPDLCCYINKVEPMQRAMKGLRGWISGIRRDQSPTRASTQILESTPEGKVRVHPMARWTRKDIWQYIHDHDLPEHPLLAQGYLSVGCAPCTRSIHQGENDRAGRWAASAKVECGLHTLLRMASGATSTSADPQPGADGEQR